jgi:ATP-dependent DNA ligase
MNYKPQLACDVSWEKLKFPAWGFRKIDGCRMVNQEGKALGRSLKPYKNKALTEQYSRLNLSGFEGELTVGNITSESLCRDTTSVVNTIKGSVDDVEWYLFDYTSAEVVNLPYHTRYDLLESLVRGLNSPDIHVVPYQVITSLDGAKEFYGQCLELGFEGAIFRDPYAKHKDGRCTINEGAYLRAKPQSDKEAICVGLVEAMENQNEAKTNELGHTERSSHKENKVGKGMVGMLQCKDCETGMLIDIGAGCMTHEERIFYWNNPDKIVGEPIKYRSMDVGVKDKPRFARFISIRAKEDMS